MNIDLTPGAETLEVRFPGGATRAFSWRWIRDHGQEATSLDPATAQRLVDAVALGAVAPPRSVEVAGDDLVVSWRDGTPPTRITLATMRSISGAAPDSDRRRPWSADDPPSPDPTVDWVDVARSDDGQAQALDLLRVHGHLVVTGLEPDLATTQALIERLGRPQWSIYGATWTVEAGDAKHADSSYGSGSLDPHTDGIYSDDAPRHQLLHFTRPADAGGDSILVDGLALLDRLRSERPDQLETLAAVPVPGRYVEPGVDERSVRPVLRLDALGRLVQISFNTYDRAPLWLPPDEMRAFYDAYLALHTLIRDPAYAIERRLGAGEALVFDNWRVLHGRTTFTGERRFQGGYFRATRSLLEE